MEGGPSAPAGNQIGKVPRPAPLPVSIATCSNRRGSIGVDARRGVRRADTIRVQITHARLECAVSAMRSDLSQRPEHERRLLPRYRVWAPTIIVPCDDTGAKAGPSFEVWVLDLSRGGLGFISGRPLKIGQSFRFTLPSDDPAVVPIHTVSQVVYNSPAAAGSHTVGAKFLAELPATGDIRRAS
jgi:hypothetical protein